MNYAKEPRVENTVKHALKEDIGRQDITSAYVIPKNLCARVSIVAKEKGILCGIQIAKLAFTDSDTRIIFSPVKNDGSILADGTVVARIYGPVRTILSRERVGLNFLGLLSGIATRTSIFAQKIRPYAVKILDTRKTIPGLRALEKYAVRVGGGQNHRISLDAMVLIKENHIDTVGWPGIYAAVKKIRGSYQPKVKIEIETRDLREVKAALLMKPDIIMLDNMNTRAVKTAVRLRNSMWRKRNDRPKFEASGNITQRTIAKFAATGIDYISLGTLTKDIDSLDFSLEIDTRRRR